jgi:hypothetical protein
MEQSLINVQQEPKKYRTEIYNYFNSIRVKADCNAIFFKNTSPTIPFYINNVLVNPGNIFTVSGNENEIDVTEYYIDMKGLQGQVLIIKKIYL